MHVLSACVIFIFRSDSGVVNIYDINTVYESNSPKPVKVLMNLTTEATHLKFNCTSELLAMASSHKQNAVKLVSIFFFSFLFCFVLCMFILNLI